MSNDNITISAALRRIAALKGEISRLTGRRSGVVCYRVDSPPAWTIETLEAKIDSARAELIDLKTRLAVANATNYVEVDGASRSLISCITELQELRGQISQDEALMGHTNAQADYTEAESQFNGERYVSVEIDHHCDLITATLDERVTSLRERFAMLNAVVEAANHTVAV